MRRRLLWFGLGSVLVIGIVVSIAYILFPFYEEDLYRESLETGFSSALGRTVKLEGPISLSFSLQPRLILENVSVSDLPWASQAHIFRAERLEIQISLIPFLQRRMKIEDIVLDGAGLFLEESSDGLKNWHFGRNEGAGIWSNAVPHLSIEPPESGRLAIKDLRLSYQSHQSGTVYEMMIYTVSVVPIDKQFREIALGGKFRDVPFTVVFKGGRLVDLLDLTNAWPIDGVLSTNGASVAVAGKIGGADSDLLADLRIQIIGERLSAMNDVLTTDLPESAPFMIASAVMLHPEGIDLSDLRMTLGTSEFKGQLNWQTRNDRPMVGGQLTAIRLQLHDFSFPFSQSDPTGKIATKAAGREWPASLPFDADLGIIINQWLLGTTDLGSLALSASVRENHVRLSPVRIHSFGGTVDALEEIEGSSLILVRAHALTPPMEGRST